MTTSATTGAAALLSRLIKELAGDSGKQPLTDGWQRTRDLLAPLGMNTMGSAREIADRIVAAGFAERKTIGRRQVTFRLSPRFKTWKDAQAAQKLLLVQKVPAGWAPLSKIALGLGKTTRGLQYIATQGRFAFKAYSIPKATRHYRASQFAGR